MRAHASKKSTDNAYMKFPMTALWRPVQYPGKTHQIYARAGCKTAAHPRISLEDTHSAA